MKYGLIGKQISYSLSPKIHSEFYKLNNIAAEYSLFDDELEALITRLNELGGFNVTIPYKEAIIKHLEEVDSAAERIGAVNTVVCKDSKWYGYNTDYYGFLETVKALGDINQNRAIILGTGGAAKAVFYVLKDIGFEEILVVSRSHGESFEGVRCISYDMLEKLLIASDLLVNCTPVGRNGEMPVSEMIISKQGAIIDLIYNPEYTPLLSKAKENEVPHDNGLRMLVVQALYAEKLWYPEVIFDIEENFKHIESKLR